MDTQARRVDGSALDIAPPALVVGLGNPGVEYAAHRHNIGAMVIAALAQDNSVSLRHHLSGVYLGQVRIGLLPGAVPGPAVNLAKTTCFMNESGRQVGGLMKYLKLSPTQLLVVHDDLDLPLGRIRLKVGGGEGGHNGLRSISQHLGTKNYLRLRCGIGRPPGQMVAADYVLRAFSKAEKSARDSLVYRSVQCLIDLAENGFTSAQMRLHSASD